jgi:hypothetical protein
MTSIDGVGKLLLISNSTLHGGGYLDHAEKDEKAERQGPAFG